MSEEVKNSLSGCFVDSQAIDKEAGSEDEDEDEDDEIQWLAYKDVASANQGHSVVKFNRPKATSGSLVDLETRRSRRVWGSFHLTDQWWEITILRSKKGRAKCLYPSDKFAMKYKLRDDARTFKDHVVQLFLTAVHKRLMNVVKKKDDEDTEIGEIYQQGMNLFFDYVSRQGLDDSLSFDDLEETLCQFALHLPEEQYKATVEEFRRLTLGSQEYKTIQVSQTLPELFRYLPQLFPHQFSSMLWLSWNKLELLGATVEQDPGLLAFKPIVARRCQILGCETSRDALTRSGLMEHVPQLHRDAILMYEYIKNDTSRNGHTCSDYGFMMDQVGSDVRNWEDALEFLEENKVTKTKVETGRRFVYLMSLWKAENIIASEISNLVREHHENPWVLDVDWDRDSFDTIRVDADQWRAAQLIAHQPVVAVSGKGGCGKTHVVTSVLKAAGKSSLPDKDKADKGEEDKGDNSSTGDKETEDLDQSAVCDGEEADATCYKAETDGSLGDIDSTTVSHGKPKPEMFLMLSAPTGKAANLLGKRGRVASYTLHQVIFSFRMLEEGQEWAHRKTNVLVVDECSLVSVSTFSFLIQLLREHADLKRIVLLGDIRQLPSIEPGNFLDDVFQSLNVLRCAVELRNNHRAESQVIVDNATKISKKAYPIIDREKFQLIRVPQQDGNDNQDTIQVVQRLLSHPNLRCHAASQFISFRRDNCEALNDICCKHYNHHRIMEHGKLVFRVGDKICCTKNGYVRLFEEDHGLMVCKKKPVVKPQTTGDSSSHAGNSTVVKDTDSNGVGDISMDTATDSKDRTGSGDNEDSDSRNEQTIRLCNGEIFFIVAEVEKHMKGAELPRSFVWLSDCPASQHKDDRRPWERVQPGAKVEKGALDTGKENSIGDGDAENEAEKTDNQARPTLFCVDKKEVKGVCKIQHAWARTIHTFQGSETDNIVYIVGRASRAQNWQHVYTAVTRGKKNVFIVGQEGVLREVIKTSDRKRKTSLRRQLTDKLQRGGPTQTSLAALSQNNTLLNGCVSPSKSQLSGRPGQQTEVGGQPLFAGNQSKTSGASSVHMGSSSSVKMINSSPSKKDTSTIGHSVLHGSRGLRSTVTAAAASNRQGRPGISPITPGPSFTRSQSLVSYIRTGMSPVSPAYRDSPFMPSQNKTVKRSIIASTPAVSTGTTGRSLVHRTSPAVNSLLQSPFTAADRNSSDSCWSDIDETQYANLETSIHSQSVVSTPQSGDKGAAIRSETEGMLPGIDSKQNDSDSASKPAAGNSKPSNDSQWSSEDDFFYQGLDLDDIEGMEGIKKDLDSDSSELDDDIVPGTPPSDFSSSQQYRSTIVTSPKTPTKGGASSNGYRSTGYTPPGMKRHYSRDSSDESYSPGDKSVSPAKISRTLTPGVSPLKRSLAKLEFK